MKKRLLNQCIFSFLILTVVQPMLAAITVADLKEYHASFVRGAKCFFGRKKCSEQDQRAWRRGSAGIVLALIAIASYIQRSRIASLFARRPKEEDITGYALNISMDTDNPILKAITNADVDALKELAKDPKNLNVVYFGKSLLAEAIQNAIKYPEEYKRITVIKILLENNARKYDYNQSAQSDLNAFNKIRWSSDARNQEQSKVLQEINKLWHAPTKPITQQSQSKGQMPKVHQLVEDGDVNKLTDLLDEGGFDVNSTYLEESLLKRAVRKAFEFPRQERRIEIVENFLNLGALVDKDTQNYLTLKNKAFTTMPEDQRTVLKKINSAYSLSLEKQKALQKPMPPVSGAIQLVDAIKNGNVNAVKALVKDPQNLTIKIKDSSLPALAASRAMEQPQDSQRVEILKILLAHKAPDDNNVLKNYLIKFNENVLKMTPETREMYKSALDTLQKINVLWKQYNR